MKKLCAWQAPDQHTVQFTPHDKMAYEGLDLWAKPEYDIDYPEMRQNKFKFGQKVIGSDGNVFIVCDIRRDAESDYIYNGDRCSGPHYPEFDLKIFEEVKDEDPKQPNKEEENENFKPKFELKSEVKLNPGELYIHEDPGIGRVISVKQGRKGFSYRVKFKTFSFEYLEKDLLAFDSKWFKYEIGERVYCNVIDYNDVFFGFITKRFNDKDKEEWYIVRREGQSSYHYLHVNKIKSSPYEERS